MTKEVVGFSQVGIFKLNGQRNESRKTGSLEVWII